MVALTGKGSHISALALNPTRNLIAFTEYGDRPLLTVYDLENRKKLKLLRCAEFKSHDVVSLAFSHDSKYILVQGGHPDYQLVYFFWEKGKVITSITRYFCLSSFVEKKSFYIIRVVSQSSGGSVGSVSFHPKASKPHDCIYFHILFPGP